MAAEILPGVTLGSRLDQLAAAAAAAASGDHDQVIQCFAAALSA